MKRSLLLCLNTIGAAALLAGCAGAEIAYQGAQLAMGTVTTHYAPTIPGKMMQLPADIDIAVKLDYKPTRRVNEYADCTFTGVAVPWDRTWSEETSSGNLAPKPGVRQGFVSIIYKRICPNQPAVDMLSVGLQTSMNPFDDQMRKPELWQGMGVYASDLDAESVKPRWLDNVVERVVRLAPTNPDAKSFVVATKNRLEKIYPQLAPQIEKAVQ